MKILFLAEKAFCSPQTHQDAEQGQPWDRYDRDTVKKWLKIFFRRFFSQQFKLFLDNLDRLD